MTTIDLICQVLGGSPISQVLGGRLYPGAWPLPGLQHFPLLTWTVDGPVVHFQGWCVRPEQIGQVREALIDTIEGAGWQAGEARLLIAEQAEVYRVIVPARRKEEPDG